MCSALRGGGGGGGEGRGGALYIQTQLWIITSQINLNMCKPQKSLGGNATLPVLCDGI